MESNEFFCRIEKKNYESVLLNVFSEEARVLFTGYEKFVQNKLMKKNQCEFDNIFTNEIETIISSLGALSQKFNIFMHQTIYIYIHKFLTICSLILLRNMQRVSNKFLLKSFFKSCLTLKQNDGTKHWQPCCSNCQFIVLLIAVINRITRVWKNWSGKYSSSHFRYCSCHELSTSYMFLRFQIQIKRSCAY